MNKMTNYGAKGDEPLEWAKAQERYVTFSVPSRMPDEPPVNDAQISEMRRLGIMASDEQLAEMGTLQAAAAIERLRQEKQQLTQNCTQEMARMEWRKYGTEIIWIIFLIVMMIWFLSE